MVQKIIQFGGFSVRKRGYKISKFCERHKRMVPRKGLEQATLFTTRQVQQAAYTPQKKAVRLL